MAMEEIKAAQREEVGQNAPGKAKHPFGHKFKKILPQNAALAIVFVIFLLYAFTLIFPVAWMFLNSFRSSAEFYKNPWKLPGSFDLTNYIDAAVNFSRRTRFGEFNLVEMFGISVILTIGGTLANVLSSAVSAYVVAKYKFFGRNFLFSLCIFTMIVPIVGTMPAQYRLMDALGLTNNILGMIISYSGSFGINFFLLYGFFKNISWSYAEAALVDGAGNAKIFFNIMLPLALPAVVSVSVLYSITVWNDYVAPSLYMRDIPTLAVGLEYLVSEYQAEANTTKIFAAMIITLIPILAVFIAFQKTIMENTVAGGLKG